MTRQQVSGLKVVTGAGELLELNNDSKPIFIVDVRTREECEICIIKNSVNIPLHNIKNGSSIREFKEMSSNGIIILYCKTGVRSKIAQQLLKIKNIKSVSLRGGIREWIEKIDNSLPIY